MLIGNGHELQIVRAGQLVAFECGAAAQPSPRIRWFRVSPSITTSSSNQNKYHNNNNQRITSSNKQLLRMDEAQIKSTLNQLDAHPQTGDSFQRLELISNKGRYSLE